MLNVYITIDTKNKKNGEVIFFKAVDIEDAKAWAHGYQEYIDNWKKKRNYEVSYMTITDGMKKVYFRLI